MTLAATLVIILGEASFVVGNILHFWLSFFHICHLDEDIDLNLLVLGFLVLTAFFTMFIPDFHFGI